MFRLLENLLRFEARSFRMSPYFRLLKISSSLAAMVNLTSIQVNQIRKEDERFISVSIFTDSCLIRQMLKIFIFE